MLYKNNVNVKNKLGKKILSSYIVIMMLLASFLSMVQIAEAANNPPFVPDNPNPNNGATSVSTTVDPSWTGGDPDGDSVTYDVYFGTENPPPGVVGNQTATTYDAGTMNYNTKYYWKIVAWDENGASTTGPIWNFTTESSFLPLSGNGTVCGFVKKNTEEPIEGATIHLNGTTQYFIQTNESGFFIFNNNVSVGHYDSEVFKLGPDGFPSQSGANFTLSADEFYWLNFTISSGGGNITIMGQVRDEDSFDALPGIVSIYMDGEPGLYQNEFETDENGNFSVNADDYGGTPGKYSVEVERVGYVGYGNWSFYLDYGDQANLDIRLAPFFEEANYSYLMGNVTSDATGEILEGAMIILLDTDFQHFVGKDIEPQKEYENNETYNSQIGYFRAPITYKSTYLLIAFVDGYYVEFYPITVDAKNTTYWHNFSLDPAAPGNIDVLIEFTDLDDAVVTVNSTVRAMSAIIRYMLDSMMGDGDQELSEEEVTTYIQMLNQSGPGMSLGMGGESGGSDDEEQMNGPAFFSVPLVALLDSSSFDNYVKGSHSGTIDGLVNTTVQSTDPIYYNATFNITLDGPILNQTQHALNLSLLYNISDNINITFLFGNFYDINKIVGSTNVTIQNNTNNLTIIPGSGEIDTFACVNVTLDLDPSISLPIIEVPTWYITDEWTFDTTEHGTPGQEITFTVDDKPFEQWDRRQYRIGDDNVYYVSYVVSQKREPSGYSETNYVTMSDLDWLNTTDKNINYLVNDVDFPLYSGKSWSAISWWEQLVDVTIISIDDPKVIGSRTYLCVKINYTNISNPDDVFAQEWYSPDIKFFVNRTRYENGEAIETFDLKAYSLAPHIESLTIYENDTDDPDALINSLDVNVTIDASVLEEPADYMLEGSLYKESMGSGRPTEITWASEELHDLTDIQVITISFSGSLINASGVNGPYNGWFKLRKLNGWEPGSAVDYISYQTDPYNYTDFQSPALSIIALSDYGNDTDENDKYDYLTMNVTIAVLETGYYNINSGLNYVISYGNWDEWFWITGTGMNNLYLVNGTTPTITLNFDGTDIYEKGYNGHYRYNIEIEDANTLTRIARNENNTVKSYDYSTFERPSIYFDKEWMANSSKHDFINNSIYLTVNASIIVEEGTFGGGTQTYDVHGGIHYTENNDFITGTGSQVTLNEEENIVPVNFNIGEIYQRNSSYIGNFTVHLGFGEGAGNPDIDNTQYITKEYNLSNPSSFPPPPITIEIASDEITPGGDYLTIHGFVNISSYDYAGQTLDFHGGVNKVQNMGDWDNWIFITGMGQWTSFNYDVNQITINFSGMEIAASGYSGPYRIWLGIDSLPDHDRLTSVEYNTYNYTIDQFASPGVLFDEVNVTDFINGTDYLTIQVPVIVNEPGTYHIGGGIHWVQPMGGWDNWVFITGMGGEYYLSGNTDLSINFDQGMIRNALQNSGLQGSVLNVNLGIENITSWQQITHLEYTTQYYSPSDFTSSAVNIISTGTSIINGDLVVNLTYNATREDQYIINGGVNTQNWWFITGTWSQPTLSVGQHSIAITFDGGQIYSSMQNGPYRIWLGIENKTTHRQIANNEYLTPAWSYVQFSAPSVRIMRENMTAGSVDYLNNSASGSYITVNVSLNASEAGTYWLDGGLHYVQNNNWQWITGTGRQVILHTGINRVPLNFNAGDIYSSEKYGSYRVGIGLRNQTTQMDIDRYDYTTKTYTAGALPEPPIKFEAMAEGDTSYGYINGSYFTVNVTLNVTDPTYAGTYDLHGGVAYRTSEEWWQHITGTGSWVDLESGLNNKTLNFNAGEIKTGLFGGYNDNLSVWIGLSNINTWTEVTHIEYITKKYSKSAFPEPGITVTATDDYVNGSYLTINLTVNVNVSTGNAGEYEVNGGIHWIDTSQGGENWRYITGTGVRPELAEGENDISLNFNAGDIYTTLSEENYNGKLTVWIGVQNITTWAQLAHTDYRTPSDYSAANFNPPSLTINCIDDYNNATDYLTVNLTINATGDSLNHNYDIHAGIHWKQGWEWRFITGYGTTINVTHNMTIPINFNGGTIRSSEHDGPYEVWVGISQFGQWQDITHDQYITGLYNYDDFAAPAVEIISDSITDYANGTDYLTINVTINASQTGDYFLEGCLHWKVGYQWRWITWAGKSITVNSAEEQTISLDFDGMQIARAAQDGWTGGTLVAWLAVRNTTTWSEITRVNEYTTGSYSPNDFTVSPITFNGTITDEGSDIYAEETFLGPPYNSLKVVVPLNITECGTYKIYAGLFESVNKTFIAATSKNITCPADNVTIYFNGTMINKKHYNGTLEFKAKIFDTVNKFECDSMINTTHYYNYTYFNAGTPEATIVGNYSNFTENGNVVINVTVHVNTINRQYELYGDLFNNASTTYITNYKNTTFDNTTAQDVIVQLVFNGTAIDASGVSAPYKLAYLRLSVYNDEEGFWEELETKTTNPYYTQGGD